MRLWTAIVTEIWAELYIDGRGAHPHTYGAQPVPSAAIQAIPALS
jgi:hypothetical protein